MAVSVEDLKKNYEKLSVVFDIWKGESDAKPYIAPMVERFKAEGFAHISEGALVVDVTEETDKKEVPPMILVKSEIIDDILRALYKAVGLKTPGQGIAFSLPVDQVVGLSSAPKPEENKN